MPLDALQAAREHEVLPLRVRRDDLIARLETVRYQLASTRTMRERSMSTTSLDMRDKTKLDMSLTRDVRNTPGSAHVFDRDDPPPYEKYFHN